MGAGAVGGGGVLGLVGAPSPMSGGSMLMTVNNTAPMQPM